MAERRMFAMTIIDSDAFLDMPLSAQALYFHLSMRADDEGFINNPKKIQRMIGASEDDAKILIAKKFLIPFETGVVVIKHWKIHNYIQKDRFKPTVYSDERSLLYIKENGTYSLQEVDTVCIQSVSNMDTQVSIGENRLDKFNYRLGSNNGADEEQTYQLPTLAEVVEYVESRGGKIDAEKFYDIYSSNGWKTAKGVLIKDWKSAVRAWERTEHPNKKQHSTEKNGSFDTDSFFDAALARTYGGK